EDHADYLADGGDGDDEPSDDDDDDDDDDDTDDKDEDPFKEEDDDEEEEHLAPANSSAIPVVDPVPSAGDTEAFETDEVAPTPVPSPRRHTARMSVRPQTPIPLPLEAEIPSPPLPPLPSSIHLPPPVPTSLPLPSSPLPPLPASLSVPPPVDRREDTPEAELLPRKRLCLTTPTSRNKVGESSTAAPRTTRGHRADYGFIGTMDAEIRRQRAEEVGYGIRDVWVDPTKAVKEVAPTTLEGVNARVTELAAVQEQDTQDIYAVIEDVGLSSTVHYELQAYRTHTQMQDYRIASHESLTATLIAQVSLLHGQLSAALGQIQALQARDQTHVDDPEGAASTANNMPPRRTSAATARAAAAAARAAAPMTAAAVEQLIEARVSAALANHETLQNSTNGHGDRSHNSDTGIRGTVRTPQNQVKFATCTFLGNALTWWNSHMKAVTQDVAYALDWKTLKKMMMDKYCPRGEIKKLKNGNCGNQCGNDNAPAKVYVVGNAGTNLDSNRLGKEQNRVKEWVKWGKNGWKKIIRINTIILGCTLNFLDDPFNINLMPVELGSFDIIIGIDRLSKYHALIDCAENIVRIPWGNETLIVHGDGSNQGNRTRLNIISCTKSHKYLLKGHNVFLAHVTLKEAEDKSREKRLEDLPIV
ncbi:reverse transcriptase domain-containing protein, partial [Tanacetum coccineum]